LHFLLCDSHLGKPSPKLKELAPEYYDNLYSHKSYTRLLLRFLFDKDLSLHSRYLREDRNRGRPQRLDSRDTEEIIRTQTAEAIGNPSHRC
jgi:hypothetical protein